MSLKASFLSRTSTNTFSRFFLDKNEREKEVIFLTQSWTSPFEKISRLPFLKSMFLLSRQACFLTRTLRNTFFLFILHKKKVEEIWNFWRKRWTYLFGKILILRFSWRSVRLVFEGFFLSRASTNTFPWSIFDKNEREKKLTFWPNHGLSPLKKCQGCLFLKSMFLLSRQACFLPKRHQTLFRGVFCIKRNGKKTSNFWQKPWTNPFGEMGILWVFEIDVFIVHKGLFSI